MHRLVSRVSLAFALFVVIGFAFSVNGQSCNNSCPKSGGSCPCGSQGLPIDTCKYPANYGCPSGYAPAENICCCSGSPVVISLVVNPKSRENAFPMSPLEDGVWFAINDSHAALYPTSWPMAKARVAFVVSLPADYHPNTNYTFDGANLFGNFTPQPRPGPGQDANGYAALAVWDSIENGGNNDGLISNSDNAVQLGIQPGGIALWIDSNHDGIAQPGELFTFDQLGVVSIDVRKYRPSHWKDKYGNHFRYTAPVTLASGAEAASFDVFFVKGDARPNS